MGDTLRRYFASTSPKGGCELHMSSGADDDAATIVAAFNALYDPCLPITVVH